MSSPSPTTPPHPPSIVCVCPYCKTGYEWWVNCDCLAEEADTEEADTEEADTEEADTEEADTEEADTEEADTEEAEEAWDADFITCDYCGNRWDGYAQCTCWGYLNSSAQVIEDEDEEDDTTRNAKGTIIEIDYGTTTDDDEENDDEDTARNAKGDGIIIEIDYGTTTDEEED